LNIYKYGVSIDNALYFVTINFVASPLSFNFIHLTSSTKTNLTVIKNLLIVNDYLAFSSKLRKLASTMSHSHSIDFKTTFTVEELPGSEVKISGELPYVELESERNAALVALGKNVELDGFRKGHVPAPVLEKHLGEMAILGEMAERAIAHSYPHIIEEHKIEAIGHPKIEVTKIAAENPLGFTVTVAVIPSFTLPDYNKIAGETNKNRPGDEVTEEEVNEKIKEIQTQKRAYERMQDLAAKNAVKAESGDGTTDLPTPESEVDKGAIDKDTPLPELTDELVKTLGQPGQFETVEDFEAKLREHLEIEKKQHNAAKHRADITDDIIEKTDITLPQVLIDSEINQMFAQMQEDLDKADLKMDDYLTHIKKTKDDMKAEWSPAAEKRAKLQLVLNEIAKAEEIVPNAEAVDAQTKELQERFKDADEQRVRLYVASVLLNEQVMKMLEEAK
jgi:trigger factor